MSEEPDDGAAEDTNHEEAVSPHESDAEDGEDIQDSEGGENQAEQVRF